MGLWTTVLAALRFRTGQVSVLVDSEPLHLHRVQADVSSAERARLDVKPAWRFIGDVEAARRVRLEAR